MEDNIVRLEFNNTDPVHGLMISLNSLTNFLKKTNCLQALSNIEYMINEYHLHKSGLGEFTGTVLYDVKPEDRS